MKTRNEVIQKVKEITNGFDPSDFVKYVEKNLLEIGSELKSRKVAGQKVDSYNVKSKDGDIFVDYVTESGDTIGIRREKSARE